jgi:hypothetical protein
VAERAFGSCTTPDCDEHYACRLRGKGLQVSPRATPSKTLNWKPTPAAPPTRNKQIMYDERPGGTKMPFLNADGSVLRQKQYDEHKHQIEANIRRIRNTPATGD